MADTTRRIVIKDQAERKIVKVEQITRIIKISVGEGETATTSQITVKAAPEIRILTIGVPGPAALPGNSKSYKIESGSLALEQVPGTLFVPAGLGHDLRLATSMFCFVDGRYMAKNSGWNTSEDGQYFLIKLDLDPDRRARWLAKQLVFDFLWAY